MPIIETDKLIPGDVGEHHKLIYCGLDCCVTMEVWEELQPVLHSATHTTRNTSAHLIYNFERALQAPILDMMERGFKVDQFERQSALAAVDKDLAILENRLNAYAHAIWNAPLNPRSPTQLIQFFYKELNLPEHWTSKKGVRKLSTDRDTLEKLLLYFHARPIILCILAIRDLKKQREVLTSKIDFDGRMRTSYNIAGTESGRLSSSSSAWGTGGNLQNITPRLRRVFEADSGKKLCVIDLEQAESREVGLLCGLLFNDWTYLDACENGDLHTTTCRMVWPDLRALDDILDDNGNVIVRKGRPWEGDKLDRKIAEQTFYRHFSYRDMSKRGGHGTTYMGTPFTMAMHLKVPVSLMEFFQAAFFEAFPAIARWHQWVAGQIQTTHTLTTPLGRVRQFFGRPDDLSTLREAVAFSPQSTTADRMNFGIYRLWCEMGTEIDIIGQVHDAVIFQYNEADEVEIVQRALSIIEIESEFAGRKFKVPGEPKVGWNWGYHHDKSKPIDAQNVYNPNGLVKFRGVRDERKRLVGLDRPVC